MSIRTKTATAMARPGRARSRVALVAAALVAGLAVAAGGETPDQLFLERTDPSRSEHVVYEAEWAAELSKALGLTSVLPQDHDARDVFRLLCADGSEFVNEAGRRVPARAALSVAASVPSRHDRGGPLRVVVSAPATALYQLTVEGVGLQRWSVDGRAIGHVDPSALGVAQVPAVMPLRAGPHELSSILAPSGRVERVELSAFRPLCIAPASGWQAQRPLTFGNKARTMVQAMGLERRLPPLGEPLPIEGEEFVATTASGGRTNRRLAQPASQRSWATAAESPSEFSYRVRLSQPGLFTLLARVHGRSPQIWSVDGRHRMTVRPGEDAGGFAWSHVFTMPLGSGEHVIRALLPRGAGIDLLRLQQRRATDADYLEVLDGVGFKEGAPDGVVTLSAARSNLANEYFVSNANGFLARLAGPVGDEPLGWVARELESLYSRPLSPTLPAEL